MTLSLNGLKAVSFIFTAAEYKGQCKSEEQVEAQREFNHFSLVAFFEKDGEDVFFQWGQNLFCISLCLYEISVRAELILSIRLANEGKPCICLGSGSLISVLDLLRSTVVVDYQTLPKHYKINGL